MEFSGRTPSNLSLNRIALAIDRQLGGEYLDLTLSNPTKCGFQYPADLLKGLSRPENLIYEPHPLGLPEAREAVAKYLGAHGTKPDPENLLLTASTSETYSFLFKLLGNPGVSFLVPHPGYPLFDYLLELDSLLPVPYLLRPEPGWPIDLVQLEQAILPATKGLIVVSPHNPTGSFLNAQDEKNLMELCRKHALAYISDEVFSDFNYQGRPGLVSNPDVLVFRLGGLSKSLGMPQLKLSWIHMEGPAEAVRECKERLELIADTYLSLNTPVQTALPDLLAWAPEFQKQVHQRVKLNYRCLEGAFQDHGGVKILPLQAGWYGLMEVMSGRTTEEEIVVELLEKHRVLVQPGAFYDFSKGKYLVLSLIPESGIFEEGIRRLKTGLSALGL